MSSSSQQGKSFRGGRVGSGGGGGRGGPSRGGGGRGSRSTSGRSRGGGREGRSGKPTVPLTPQPPSNTILRDEDVLIAFAPYVRNEHSQATDIHAQFQSTNDQRAFLKAARLFLRQQQQHEQEQQKDHDTDAIGPRKQEIMTAVSPSPLVPPQSPCPVAMTKAPPPSPAFHPIVTQHEPTFSLPNIIDFRMIEQMERLVMDDDDDDDPIPPSSTLPTTERPSIPVIPPRTISTDTDSAKNVAPPGLSLSLSSSSPKVPDDIVVMETPPIVSVADLETKPKYQPKRLWTRLDQQPGRLMVNGTAGYGQVVLMRPRKELEAKWMLPLSYLRERTATTTTTPANTNMTLEQAVESLRVGLFRRGCTENGTQVSIISKECVKCSVDARTGVVWGAVPFYAPRTPGNVVLRLYWDDEPLYTLATGPTLNIQVAEPDVEPTLRFILSNFKAKKGSGTSLSSLHSLTAVLEQFHPTNTTTGGGYNNSNNNPTVNRWEGAGRAAWGCICESRKVLEACAVEYGKNREKLNKLDSELHELKLLEEKCAAETKDASDAKVDKHSDGDEGTVSAEKLKERINAVMGSRASNERKWRDAQVAFASIIKAVISNQGSAQLLKRDLIAKLRLEYELWCPLCESFAPSPFNHDQSSLCVDTNDFPHPVTGEHIQRCAESRTKMQMNVLGFIPNTIRMEQIVMPSTQSRNNNQGHQNRALDPKAVDTFNRLTGAMGQLYQNVYMVTDRVHQQRELVRAHIEGIVSRCDAFPNGTRVVVFGSSANGFGSPSSDLDMCLQLPPNTTLVDENDTTGAHAMAKLAGLLEGGGMKNVDTVRLTARIPIVMFACPRPMANESEDPLMECDLSMQNPLACLNTSLLLTYSQIHPVTCVLMSIIKQWAKNRDMNSPSNHTLSTYGYILMLIHFLTYHKRTGTGLVTSIENRRDDEESWAPLLPNLQWMDVHWPKSPPGTPYKEFRTQPKSLMPHPLESSDVIVNTHFYRLTDQSTQSELQNRFPCQDLSLSILLASFFRYYAYEFDYKRHVVSLHSTASNGIVEREVKAEIDGWKVFGTALSIEDPFETFYDVAHVLKGSNFHRLRNEFALAYSKIADLTSGRKGSWDKNLQEMTGMDMIEWICEPYTTEQQE